jgi:thiol-disulfide isomerase/thioredoxin
MKAKFIYFALALMMLFPLNSNASRLKSKPSTISVKIRNYKGDYKMAKFSYFDIYTQQFENKVLVFDDEGKSEVKLDLVYPLFHSATFNIVGQSFPNFLIMPGKDYNFEFDYKYIFITDESGKINRSIYNRRTIMSSEMYDFNWGRCYRDIMEESNPTKLIKWVKKMEQDRYQHLKDYCKEDPLPENVKKLIRTEIKYSSAYYLMLYRKDMYTGKIRDNLPKDYVKNIIRDYPLKDPTISTVGGYNKYLGLLADYFTLNSNPDEFEIIRLLSEKTDLESFYIDKIARLIKGDELIRKDVEFMTFIKGYYKTLNKIFTDYKLESFLNAGKSNIKMGSKYGNDIVLKQQIVNFLNSGAEFTDNQWKIIDKKLDNKNLLTSLQNIQKEKEIIKKQNEKEKAKLSRYFDQIKDKYLAKHKGKVVYIDFFATWCGPCKSEIPHSKKLHEKFKGKDVVFLNMCMKSREEDWAKMMDSEELIGENYFIEQEEDNLLTEMFKVNGYPTYILIDKNGEVANYQAPRPSWEKSIEDAIKELL